MIKEYLAQIQAVARYFHESSYKLAKQDPILNKNIYLNIAEELK